MDQYYWVRARENERLLFEEGAQAVVCFCPDVVWLSLMCWGCVCFILTNLTDESTLPFNTQAKQIFHPLLLCSVLTQSKQNYLVFVHHEKANIPVVIMISQTLSAQLSLHFFTQTICNKWLSILLIVNPQWFWILVVVSVYWLFSLRFTTVTDTLIHITVLWTQQTKLIWWDNTLSTCVKD